MIAKMLCNMVPRHSLPNLGGCLITVRLIKSNLLLKSSLIEKLQNMILRQIGIADKEFSVFDSLQIFPNGNNIVQLQLNFISSHRSSKRIIDVIMLLNCAIDLWE